MVTYFIPYILMDNSYENDPACLFINMKIEQYKQSKIL